MAGLYLKLGPEARRAPAELGAGVGAWGGGLLCRCLAEGADLRAEVVSVCALQWRYLLVVTMRKRLLVSRSPLGCEIPYR